MVSPNGIVAEALYRINLRESLNKELVQNAFNTILNDTELEQREVQLGAFLTGMMAKGPTLEETIAIMDIALKQDFVNPKNTKEIKLPKGYKLIGAVGSGKKGVKTMNISTPSMVVASSVGAYVAKPGSSSTSSVTGSTDLSFQLGINLNHDIDSMIEIIKKCGFGIFSIESLIPNFDRSYGGKFYAPHILSFGFPGLVSPVKMDGLLYGLAHPNVDLSVDVFNHYGFNNVLVAACTDDNIHYIDEIGVHGKTFIKGIKDGTIGDKLVFNPTRELGLPEYTSQDISQGKSIFENVKYVVDSIRGNVMDSAREDIICVNAGNLLYMSNLSEDLEEGYKMAKANVKNGKALKHLRRIIEETKGDQSRLERFLK